MQVLNDTCLCDLTASHITEREWSCHPELNSRLIFSATLHETLHASTTELIRLLNMWINADNATINITGEYNGIGVSTEVLVERLITPNCSNGNNSIIETTPIPSDSVDSNEALSVSEKIMWTAIVFFIFAIVVIIVLSVAVVMMKRTLSTARYNSR